MASTAEVEHALRELVSRLAGVDRETRGKHVLERTVSCRVPDLDVVWTGRLDDDGLSELTDQPCDSAQIRLRVASDDLLALAEGRLPVVQAWATGKLKVEASARDLMRLRTLL